MYIDTDKIVTMTAANQNFSAVARQTERDGKSVIFKNNRPKYILIDLDDGGYLGQRNRYGSSRTTRSNLLMALSSCLSKSSRTAYIILRKMGSS